MYIKSCHPIALAKIVVGIAHQMSMTTIIKIPLAVGDTVAFLTCDGPVPDLVRHIYYCIIIMNIIYSTLLEKEAAMSAQKSGSGLFYGYVIVTSTVVIFAAAFGVHYSFGLFFKPMASEFGWSRSMMSGAFSLSWLLHGIAAIFLGRWTDRYGPRIVLVFSAILLSSGYLLTTWINSPWQFYATYGVLVGIGTGGVYVPLVSTIARWFVVHRTRMTGIAVAGVGMGTFVVPLIANRLISAFGWRTTYEVLGIAVLIIVIIFSLVLKRDPTLSGQHPDGARTVSSSSGGVDGVGLSLYEALRSLKFWNICAQFFCFGYFTYSVLVHIAPYSTDQGLSTVTAAYFVSVIGMASIIGKLLLGRLGDSIGNRNIYLLCFIMVMVAMGSTLLLPAHLAGYPFVVTIGLAYGGCSASHSPFDRNPLRPEGPWANHRCGQQRIHHRRHRRPAHHGLTLRYHRWIPALFSSDSHRCGRRFAAVTFP